MDLKAGYKQTEVGELPDDWRVTCLKDIVRSGPKNGYSGPTSGNSASTPTLSLSATTTGRLLLNQDTVKYLTRLIPGGAELFLRADDVLVQRSNTIELVGTAALFTGPDNVYVYPDLMMRLRFGDRVSANWFWRIANSASGRRYFKSVAAGSTGSMPKLTGQHLREMPVPLPPTRAEQEAIVKALTDADALIESLEQLLAKKRQLKQGAMQELLTGKRRLPGFDTEWKVKRLGEIVNCASSGTYGIERALAGTAPMPVATTAQISDEDRWNGKAMPIRYFTPRQVSEYGVSVGDLIVVKSSGSAANIKSGKLGLVDDTLAGTFLFSNFLMRLRPVTISSMFLYYYLTSYAVKSLLPSLVEASTYPNIRINEYLDVAVPVPDRDEQDAIAAVLSDLDEEIAALEAKLAKARQVKQGMMQELLTGRIRLVDPQGATA